MGNFGRDDKKNLTIILRSTAPKIKIYILSGAIINFKFKFPLQGDRGVL
jgi:hypothetical protein